MKFFSNWTAKKHAILSLIIILIMPISSFISKTDSSSIGIIGGSDGPTVIFVSGNPVIESIIPKLVMFLLLLGLYIPMKKYFQNVSKDKEK